MAYALQALADAIWRQGFNRKPYKHQLETLTEPNPSTVINIGALQEAAYTTGPDEQQKPATDKNKRGKKSKTTAELMEEPAMRTTPEQHATTPRKDTMWGITWITGWN